MKMEWIGSDKSIDGDQDCFCVPCSGATCQVKQTLGGTWEWHVRWQSPCGVMEAYGQRRTMLESRAACADAMHRIIESWLEPLGATVAWR